jgi:hypothetical protein
LSYIAGACVFAFLIASTTSADPFTFDDIKFWVGSGTNRAALVIDWVEDSTELPALAWGYRWDGGATGSDMLTAIVAADPRLVAKLGGTPGNPNSLFGLGYDADNDNNDESFRLAIRDEFGQVVQVTMPFDQDGFFYTEPADGEEALDNDSDYYAEGWFDGFWHYGVAATNPYDGGAWSDIVSGMHLRTLSDGAWDSWAFTPSFDFSAFAENPVAALPPAGPGDFNGDGGVDQADFNLWRSTFGSTSDLDADANMNGVVDAADYVVWRKYAQGSMGSSAGLAVSEPTAVVPEPATLWLSSMSLLATVMFLTRKRKENVKCSDRRRLRHAGLHCYCS